MHPQIVLTWSLLKYEHFEVHNFIMYSCMFDRKYSIFTVLFYCCSRYSNLKEIKLKFYFVGVIMNFGIELNTVYKGKIIL